MKNLFYAIGSIAVAAWCLSEIWAGLSTGVLELPAARGHPHDDFASRVEEPLWFWAGIGLWTVILVIVVLVGIGAARDIWRRGTSRE